MNAILIAFALAIGFGIWIEPTSIYIGRLLSLDPSWDWLVRAVATVIALAMVVWGIYSLATKKSEDDVDVWLLMPGDQKSMHVRQSKVKKILKWLRDN